jgi:hypothetical protein
VGGKTERNAPVVVGGDERISVRRKRRPAGGPKRQSRAQSARVDPGAQSCQVSQAGVSLHYRVTRRPRADPTLGPMSAILSALPARAGVRRAGAAPGSARPGAPSRGASAVRRASLNDKLNELKSKVNLPDVPKIDLPNVSLPNIPAPGGDSGSAASSPGYKPASGDDLYVGQGRYIKDDQEGFVSKTGRDSTLVGGFAGGEKGLWKYREDRLGDDPAAKPKEWKRVYGARKGTDEVDLGKDFGGMAGGFPGGEIGVKAFNATGEIATRDAPPTLGWGPPVLLLAAIGSAGYYLNPGDPEEELGAVVSAATGAKAAVDSSLSPEQQTLALEAAGGVVAAVVVVNLLAGAVKKAGEGLVDAAKVAALGAATLAVAGKVLELY